MLEHEHEHVSDGATVAETTATACPPYTATYSAEDNKLRLYAAVRRLDRETYDRVHAAGFAWAPKQELFVAPKWTPEREDLLLELAGVVDDEETPLADRAAERAERFEVYSDKRGVEAGRALAHVERIAGGIPLGQPILVGHHSERKARKDAERIENGMRAAVRLNDTAQYWERRAERVTRHAAYKADPGLRARRIKTLEAEERAHLRELDHATTALALWTKIAATEDADAQRAKALHVANVTGPWGVWGDITDGKTTVAEACVRCIACYEARIPVASRWVEHVQNRLAYERVLLGRAPDEKTKVDRTRRGSAALPLLNYRGEGGSLDGQNKWHRGETLRHSQVDMTSAEYAKIHPDYKGTNVSLDGSHRFRVAIVRSARVAVFLSDAKVHPCPLAKVAPVVADDAEEPAEVEEVDPVVAGPEVKRALDAPAYELPAAPVDPFEAMRASLRSGVRAVSVPELFVTPAPLAQRVVDAADIRAGALVLEPSAGLGALAIAARERGASVVCVDNAPAMVAALRRAGFETTHEADFLELTPESIGGRVDRVVMNPPFSAEVEHVRHAWGFLRPGGRLVSVMSAGVRFHGTRAAQAFRAFVDEHGTMEQLPAGSFASSGTGANTVLVVLDKPRGAA